MNTQTVAYENKEADIVILSWGGTRIMIERRKSGKLSVIY